MPSCASPRSACWSPARPSSPWWRGARHGRAAAAADAGHAERPLRQRPADGGDAGARARLRRRERPVRQGYTCNVAEISHTGRSGGYRVERYVDGQGNECGYYDSTLLWPTSLADHGTTGPGTYVLDMKDPANPVVTDVLRTAAFQSPHESVRLTRSAACWSPRWGTRRRGRT